MKFLKFLACAALLVVGCNSVYVQAPRGGTERNQTVTNIRAAERRNERANERANQRRNETARVNGNSRGAPRNQTAPVNGNRNRNQTAQGNGRPIRR